MEDCDVLYECVHYNQNSTILVESDSLVGTIMLDRQSLNGYLRDKYFDLWLGLAIEL